MIFGSSSLLPPKKMFYIIMRNTQTKLTLESIIYNLSKPDLNDVALNKKSNKTEF